MSRESKVIELIHYVEKQMQKLKRQHDEYHEWEELRDELKAYLNKLLAEKSEA